MSLPLDAELVQEAMERAQQEILDEMAELLALNVGPNGETFGTEHMTREDRILAFLTDAQSGAVDALFTINPKFGEQYVKAYQRDLRAMPTLQANPDRTIQDTLLAGPGG